ncbi:MerR family transcriptional regulator [Marimonas arenosa]|uniref:MerR family transcriptional regulator n=1 Tax=Marimonas arenosa TaxID=1795305 RepID=A0AAE3W957_9RHOB|nr:MerR family transcriptional regulator [Marimonas arenosa]MDQ2088437.1 MerR family transcriptional regulator [Marimonas arenosa]
MAKSADAFRTISEVADWLGVPAHVLRFWESKFSQVKPVKRAGGRRYYRPTDMQLLGGIKKLLHDDGMTIKGVQKVLREQGVKHVSSFSKPLEFDTGDTVEGSLAQTQSAGLESPVHDAAESASVVPFQRDVAGTGPDDMATVAAETFEPITDSAGADDMGDIDTASEPVPEPDDIAADMAAEVDEDTETAAGQATGSEDDIPAGDTSVLEDFAAPPIDAADTDAEAEPAVEPASPGTPETAAHPDQGETPADAEPAAATGAEDESGDQSGDLIGAEPETAPAADLPGFLHRTTAATHDLTAADEAGPDTAEAEQEPEPEPLRPAMIDLPPDPEDDEISAPPGVLASLAARRGRPLAASAMTEAAALRDKLAALAAHQGAAGPE